MPRRGATIHQPSFPTTLALRPLRPRGLQPPPHPHPPPLLPPTGEGEKEPSSPPSQTPRPHIHTRMPVGAQRSFNLHCLQPLRCGLLRRHRFKDLCPISNPNPDNRALFAFFRQSWYVTITGGRARSIVDDIAGRNAVVDKSSWLMDRCAPTTDCRACMHMGRTLNPRAFSGGPSTPGPFSRGREKGRKRRGVEL